MPPVVIVEADFTKDKFENANCKTILQAEIKVILFPGEKFHLIALK